MTIDPMPPASMMNEKREDEVETLVATLMPWLVSILMHAALLLLAVFIVWSTASVIEEVERPVVEGRLTDNPRQPLRMMRREISKPTTPGSDVKTLRDADPADQQSYKPLIGTAGGSGGAATINTPGGGTAGKSSPFGTDPSGGPDFGVEMFGQKFGEQGGNVRRVVYVVDASGSLIDTLPLVIKELKRSIAELSHEQAFSVIFFRGDEYLEVPPPGMRDATNEYKRQVNQWLSPGADGLVPAGGGSPVEAIEQALQYRPDVMYLLSDNITGRGRYSIDQKKLIEKIEAANKRGTKIGAIQFVYDDPLARYGLPRTLELIARRSGGKFTFVRGTDLGLTQQVGPTLE
ncbi:MAG: VWA domain-containing protein [Phycisphaeraceae bacterium]|nr:VWA domain-containing protein [Phycisphaeraceae bacterium]